MADVTVEARPYRYTRRFTATAAATSYEIKPVTGRPEQSYFSVLNTGTAVLEVAFGEDGTLPNDDDYVPYQPNGSLEPLPGFFARGEIVMYIKGGSTFHVMR